MALEWKTNGYYVHCKQDIDWTWHATSEMARSCQQKGVCSRCKTHRQTVAASNENEADEWVLKRKYQCLHFSFVRLIF